MGMEIARIDDAGLLDHIFEALEHGRGGWLVTANLDILRRHCLHSEGRELYARADLRVADGMPLVWATALLGQALPQRIAGSSLVWSLAERAAEHGRSLHLLGGAAGSAEGAASEFRSRWQKIDVSGDSSPVVDSPPTEQQLRTILEDVIRRQPDILLVGLGSPKQEQVIDALRQALPRTWMIGVGISFSFVSGQVDRAPLWMRRSGLEWVHRLAQEPKRLARRYFVDDASFALRLFAHCLLGRVSIRGRRPAS